MLNIGMISLTSPWALSALLLLPLLWQLLKVTPPKPTVIKFPAVRILQELSTSQTLATNTPWWILLLRSLIAISLIIAMTGPRLNQTESTLSSDRPHIILIDNDWSVMERWANRKQELEKLVAYSQHAGQPTLVITTASKQKIHYLENQEVWEKHFQSLTPKPWPVNRQPLIEQIEEIVSTFDQVAKISWISNGLVDENAQDFLANLHQLGDVDYIHDGDDNLPIILQQVKRNQNGLIVTLKHAPVQTRQEKTLHVLDENGAILFQHKATLKTETTEQRVQLSIPNELKSRADKVRLQGAINPASQYLLDEKWRDRSVGIIRTHTKDQVLLAPAYYVKKSLRPHTSIREAPLDELLQRQTAVIFDVASTNFTTQHVKALQNWLSQGGILVRFANKHLTTQNSQKFDPLLPVQLMPAQRTFGGTLSWKQATHLAPFPEHSPFQTIPIGDDIIIKQQVLARPEASLHQKTWAQLKDGTPLITAQQMDKGWSVLFHVNAIPSWSNLPLSGTFELMMKQLLTLSTGHNAATQNGELVPYRVFDHLGQLVAPSASNHPIKNQNLKALKIGPAHPPGLYGNKNKLKALNLGPQITHFTPIHDMPLGVNERGFQPHEQTDLAPWALLFALCLALIDWLLANSWLQSVQRLTALFCLCVLASPSFAKEPNWEKALAAANHMRLAYMETGNPQLDKTLRQGLDGLAMVMRRRTAVEMAPTMAFDPEKDDPSLFPMIYWAIEGTQPELSEQAAHKLNVFLQTGGFILFDTMGQAQPQQLARMTEKLNIAPLQTIPDNHVLTRSFYLMRHFPGRFNHPDVWVEASENTKNDRVSSVLIGSNSWVQAWARDEHMRPLYAVVPDGEIQREQAFRFGINLVMYILSGNYKGDQVHIPAILQRLGL
ncbi:DUF4159 domain-containing protein [Terasakiella sp. SH-1]|uniref:DUF4159 domain-containing protein n=1 Tax=Terasakiella sp. SH-1 TaxID=2560057 RepID=UPI001073DAC8|nr:DUF4159 domain-containing protein [Terasakiella sp. SH-1]